MTKANTAEYAVMLAVILENYSATHCSVSTVDPVIPPEFAPIVLVPAARHCARPGAALGAF